MRKVLITGGGGNFAKKLVEYNTKYSIIALNRKELDVTNPSIISWQMTRNRPDIVIHAAAMTRPMKNHRNSIKSMMVNIGGTMNVIISCMQHGVKFVYLSTDYVYPGTGGNYAEDSPLLPVNEYAWSKLGGECITRLYDNSLILRISMVENPFPHDKGIVDSKKSIIYNDDAAKIVLQLLDETGVINIGGEASTIYEFVKKDNPNLGKIYLNDIYDVQMPTDSTMNIEKMKRILDDKSV